MAVVVTHSVVLAWAAVSDTPTWDEVAHLPTGASHWKYGRFDLFRVNPPLGAAPVLPSPEQRPLVVASEELLQGRRELWIEHRGELYRLRVTSAGKLYMTK